MRTAVCIAVPAAGVLAAEDVKRMNEIGAVCCGGWMMFLVAVITITEILSQSISNYINAKADEARARAEQYRKKARQ